MKKELQYFSEIAEKLLADEKNNPVSDIIKPEELMDSLSIELREQPITDSEFITVLTDIILKTPKTTTNQFFNQLFGGRQPKAVLGELLAVMLNNSMYTYKVAGPQVGIEKEIIKKSCNIIDFGDSWGGTIPAGGSMSNLMAMIMGRDYANRSIMNKGGSGKMIAYTSSDSHYSIPKNAAFTGIGRENVRYIPTNAKGEMQSQLLQQQIKSDITKGFQPFFINATAGTTVLGAFDPIEEIAAIAKRYNLWLHVDGAYCGSVIFSEKYKHLIKGVQKANSFNYNAHKMLGTPLSCSILLVKNKEDLYTSFSNEANYLYQTDHDEFNLGKTSLQCGRRNDALKFWSLWKSVGTQGIEAIVDKQFYLADIARNYIKSNPDYKLYSFKDSISICFNYKGISAEQLCTHLYKNKALLVGFGSFGADTFIRLVTINANNDKEEIIQFFKRLEEEARTLVLV